MPKLTIAIPTFKRPVFLSELLGSICTQIVVDVEVLIIDDFSCDETGDVLRQFSSSMPSLRFIENQSNIGLDENFIKLAQHARGDYIWFMGDDDRVEPGGLRLVLDAIDKWPDAAGMTLGVIDYDVALRSVWGIRTMPETQLMHGTAQTFAAAIHLLGFMSALVVKRSLWTRACNRYPLDGFKNLYLQVYVVGKMIDEAGVWLILNEPCVGFRTSNDQYFDKFGLVRRLEIDIDAYTAVIDGLFPKNPALRRELKVIILRTHVLARLKSFKTKKANRTTALTSLPLLFRHYRSFPQFWFAALPIALVPNALLRSMKAAYQAFSPTSGARKAKRLLRPPRSIRKIGAS